MALGVRCLVGALGGLLASLCVGCASQPCTLIGGIDGISVRLDDSTANRLANGHVELCIDGACSDQQVAQAGTAMVQTCDEHGKCADSTTPQVDNTHLFFAIGDPADVGHTDQPQPRTRTVSVTLRSFDQTGRPGIAGTAKVDLKDTYLNGSDCGVTSRVGNISVTATGVSVTS